MHPLRRIVSRPLAFLPLAAALVGCATPSAGVARGTTPAAECDAPALRYAAAVSDASQPTSDEIEADLWALAPTQPELVWEGEGGERRVRVVTWTAWNGYDAAVGTEMPLTREVWVTAVPQLRDACRGWDTTGDPLVARLREYLGLPPDAVKTRFVELLVAPADAFRPCPDPEVDDTRCELAFPPSASDAHRRFVEELRARSYGEGGYPWTQLGYTYDWGSASHVGASEFVVRAGATVRVVAVHDTATYCAAP